MEKESKICSKCSVEQDINNFRFNNKKLNKRHVQCKNCDCIYREINKDKISKKKKLDYINNKEKVINRSAIYYLNNKDNILQYQKEYNIKNSIKIKEKQRIYYNLHREEKREYDREFRRQQRKDSYKKLKFNISTRIYQDLKKNNFSKKENSILKYLPQPIDQIKIHLESKFDHWMNWNNHGKYNSKAWDDNDYLTWTWNIDHIIPQSKLPYQSMSDENFKKCWALDNLRPLSAKQNVKDGNRR